MDIRYIIVGLVLLLIAASGCVDQQIPGLNIEEKKVVEKPDVLTIESVKVVPESSVLPGSSVMMFITIKNKADKSVNYVLDIFNPSFFSVTGYIKSHEIAPQGEDVIVVNLTAPSKDEIGNVAVTTSINFRVLYNYSTTTMYDVAVVNMDEIKRSQLSGKPISITLNKHVGSGPVQIDMNLIGSTEGAKYILSGRSGVINLVIENRGSGDLKGNKIRNERLIIKPINYGINLTNVSSFLKKSGNVLKNSKEIQLYKQGQSSPIQFKVESKNIHEPFKTYTIVATANYTYELRGSKSITITPTIE